MLKGRARLLRGAVALALLGLVGRLVWVQVFAAADITARADEIRLQSVTLNPLRGAIYDRNGLALAVSVKTYTAVADAGHINDLSAAADKLAGLLQMDRATILKKLQENPKSGYVPLKSKLTEEQKQKLQEQGLGWLYFEEQQQRSYPQGWTANQVIGYVDSTQTDGQYGLEEFYNDVLRGTPGHIRAEMTPYNTPIEGTVKEEVAPKPGQDIVLTIDAALNKQVEAKLDQVVKETKANRALAIAMDVNTGEILLMAERPGADPGDRSTWLTADGKDIDYNKINNWAVTTMSPGSIFKTVTTSAALEEHTITPTSTFYDKGYVVIDGWTIRNWDGYVPTTPTPKSISELLQASSNIGLIQVGQTMTHDQFLKYLKGFGFMDPTGLDFPGDRAAYFGETAFDKKAPIDWANMYIGQHLEVTPIQMITAVAAIANGGYLVTPHLVREIRNPDGTVVKTIQPEKRRQVISSQTAAEMRSLMLDVINLGTATGARMADYQVAGKTGTAQKFLNGVMKPRMLADMVGIVPASNPRIAMLIMVDEPEGSGYGGVFAAPLFPEFSGPLLQKLRIPPDKKNTTAPAQPTTPSHPSTVIVPNVVGLPPGAARDRLAQVGLNYKMTGNGPVITAQSVKSATPASWGQTVNLTATPKDPKSDKVLVPDFSGLSVMEASQLAQELGLVIKTQGSGFVNNQDQRPGNSVASRTTITLTLAPDPPPAVPTLVPPKP